MTARYKIAIVSALLCMVMAGGQGCNKWLEVEQPNTLSYKEFWQTKEEAQGVAMGAYVQLRASIEKITQWGELRSDITALGPAVNTNEAYMSIKELNIRSNNDICVWNPIYNAIGRANQVIKFGPDVLSRDNTLDPQELKYLVGEMRWLRCLCYFYLVRTFRDVPYVTEPYMTDEKDFATAKTDGFVILQKLADELEELTDGPANNIPPTFLGGEDEPELAWQRKGRATYYAAAALLADVYLWLEKYPEAIRACNKVIASERFSLAPMEEWFDLYYPGNHEEESIFELQWSNSLGQTNNLQNWFWNKANDNPRFVITKQGKDLYGDPDMILDVRGEGGTYFGDKIWKYGGATFGGNSERANNDNNWIVYRYADILLMKAEALVMQAETGGGIDDAKLQEAYDLVIQIRQRAGIAMGEEEVDELTVPTNEQEGLAMVMEERTREFAFEGKRWYDMVRMAVRDNGKYKDDLIEALIANASAKNRPILQAKLQNMYGYFLPIHESALNDASGVLIQNPYYL